MGGAGVGVNQGLHARRVSGCVGNSPQAWEAWEGGACRGRGESTGEAGREARARAFHILRGVWVLLPAEPMPLQNLSITWVESSWDGGQRIGQKTRLGVGLGIRPESGASR